MKKVLLLLFYTLLLFSKSPFETKKEKKSYFDMSVYETKMRVENVQAANNEKIKCRWVCDKKIYTEQKISEAVSFYKNSKIYNFTPKQP